MSRGLLAVGSFLALAVACPMPARAQGQCAAAKEKCAAKKAVGLLACHIAAETRGTAVDPTCLDRQGAKLTDPISGCFAKAESTRPPCLTTDDAGAIEGKVDAFVDDVVTELDPGYPTPVRNRCSAAKKKCVAKKVKALLKCQAKATAAGVQPNPDCVLRAQTKFGDPVSGCFARAETKLAPCLTTGDADAIESKVDAFVQDVTCEIFPTASCTPPSCCNASERMTLTSDGGTVELSTIGPRPFPAGAVVTIDIGPPNELCDHVVLVPPGGFTVPTFCLPAAGFSMDIIATGCEAGGNDGLGDVWDGGAPAPTPGVTKAGDTSDPSTAACGTLGTGCGTGAGQAGADTGGNVNTTRGGSPLAAGKLHVRLDVPVEVIVWNDADFECPDADGVYDSGSDVLITRFSTLLTLTTGTAGASFTDLNADGCSFAGAGPVSQSATGAPANGPCCVGGQALTLAASGLGYSGQGPFFDLSFQTLVSATVSACGVESAAGTCVLTTDPCRD